MRGAGWWAARRRGFRALGGIITLTVGCLLAGTQAAVGQSEIEVLERRVSAMQSTLNSRLSELQQAITQLTDTVERLRREQLDRSQQAMGLIDEIRYQLADMRRGLMADGTVVASAGDVAPAPESDGTLGVIRVPMDSEGNPIVEDSTAALTSSESSTELVEPDESIDINQLLTAVTELENEATEQLSPEELFEAAKNNLRDGFETEAVGQLEEFLQRNPNHELAGEAKFWIAEAHFGLGDFQQASKAYIRVYQEHRDGTRAADSMLRVGMALARLGQDENACIAFEKVREEFPNAPARLQNRNRVEAERAGCT